LPTYRVLITHEVLGIPAPSLQQRRLILGFLNHLANDPFQTGDYNGKDEVGRSLQIKIIGSHALTYWADHAAQEVKVIKIEKARRR
jgi:hypothetical protein